MAQLEMYDNADDIIPGEMISVHGKTNFFERRNAEYTLSNFGSTELNHKTLDLEADF
ncbi:hypothetical protein ARMGADRAFT_1085948 [Armillaria gallica]|uniref:Uncharacterized protein n=1 Tax=Armillaria gallica TaxID=47427 RepID=A0A2H3CVY9_ARMGA|nr:hypothetical protein ARMGADRAFT_1085948 [Armillaria gallica]